MMAEISEDAAGVVVGATDIVTQPVMTTLHYIHGMLCDRFDRKVKGWPHLKRVQPQCANYVTLVTAAYEPV